MDIENRRPDIAHLPSRMALGLYACALACIVVTIVTGDNGMICNLILSAAIVLAYHVGKHDGIRSLDLTTFHAIDIAIVGVAGYELASYYLSTYPSNSIHFTLRLLSLTIVYFAVRLFLYQEILARLFKGFLALTGGIVSCSAIISFYIHSSKWKQLEFGDLTNLKPFIDLARPAGTPLNEWITIYFVFMLCSLVMLLRTNLTLMQRLLWGLCLFAPIYVIILSFSRGAYIALICGIVVEGVVLTGYRLVKLRRLFAWHAILLILLLVCVYPVRHASFTTIVLFKTQSQMRSISGRITSVTNSRHVIRKHPFFGVGTDNTATQHPLYKSTALDASFSGRPYSLLNQLIVEKGLAGVIVHLCLFALALRVLHRVCKNTHIDMEQRLAAAAMIAVLSAILVRDLTYSSLLKNHAVLLLLYILIALVSRKASHLQQHANNASRTGGWHLCRLGIALTAALIPMLSWMAYKYENASSVNRHAQLFVRSFNRRQYEPAASEIGRAVSIDPNNALYASYQGLVQERLMNIPFDTASWLSARQTHSQVDRGRLSKALAAYNKAIALNPYDAYLYHNAAWLYMHNRELGKADLAINKALDLEPGDKLNFITRGIFYEKENKMSDAGKAYMRALVISPSLVDSRFFKDLTNRAPFWSNAILRESIRSLGAEVQKSNSAILKARLGKLCMADNQSEYAFQLITGAVRALPQLSMAWYNLARIRSSNNSDPTVKSLLDRSLALDNFGYHAQIAMGHWFYGQKQYARAAHFYQWGLENWKEQKSDHAEHAAKIYPYSHIVADDTIPSGYAQYLGSEVDDTVISDRIAQAR